MERLRLRVYKAIPGTNYNTPKEVWGFRTPPRRKAPALIAGEFLRTNADLFGLPGIIGKLRLKRTVESLGAWHVIFQQHHLGMRVHRAYVSVHINRARRAYLAKNRAVPRDFLPKRARYGITARDARRRALRAVRRSGAAARISERERIWYPARRLLHPAFKFRIHREKPLSEWIVYVDGERGRILSKYDNLARAEGTAKVFIPNPVIAAPEWNPLTKKGRPAEPPDEAYTPVRLRELKGKYLDGPRVSTALTPRRVGRPDHRFEFASTKPGFDEAMAYYHIDQAVRYLESLGFRGSRAIFGGPIPVNAHGTQDDNSWYSPGRKSLTFGTGGVDDAEDAEIILHELGHAIQDAICHDFGQSPEAAAMGEGFGDYIAASFFAALKPDHLRPCVGTWDGVILEGPEPRCLRRVDESVTYESFDHSPNADEHENGKIWSATLWDIWQAVGPEIADRIIIESHFQLDGFTTFARGARAILDADRNLYHSRHMARLRQIFRQRGIGPVE